MAAEEKRGLSGNSPAEEALKARVEIVNKRGLHGRAAARVVTAAKQFSADIDLTFAREADGRQTAETADCKEIIKLMMLGAPMGAALELRACGEDAREALAALSALFASGFNLDDE